jgi:hypothetical protein
MATVNKDFKIKSGLIVEGTTATVNGYDILTKKTADQNYIIGLIGGSATAEATPDTVVLRDGDANFAANEITANLFVGDLDGQAATVDSLSGHTTSELTEAAGALYFTDSRAQDAVINVIAEGITTDNNGPGGARRIIADTTLLSTKTYADQVAGNAYNDATDYTDSAVSTEVTNRNSAISTAISTEVTNRNSAISTAKGEAIASSNGYTDSAISQEVTDRNSAIETAKGEAIDTAEGYTDSAISTEVTNRNSAITTAIDSEVTARNSAIATAKSEAIDSANSYTDTAVADLVNGAPALLDTLGELATALQENPDIISDLQDIAAGKQDSFTAGDGLTFNGTSLDIELDPVSGLSLAGGYLAVDTNSIATRSYADGAASDALDSANGYTDSAISTEVTNRNSAISTAKQEAIDAAATDATTKAGQAESNANDYTDSAISTEVSDRNSAISDAISTEVSNRNGAISDAISTEVSDRNSAITSAVNALTTSDIEEGTNLYFTDARAKTSAADLLTGASLTNITITGTGAGLTITAENGVADSTTDDLDEGSTNLYFTDQRVLDAVDNSTITPAAVSINNYRKEEATQQHVANTSTVNVHEFSYPYESAKYLVRVVGWVSGVKHSQLTEILMTTDGNGNIAITEYGTICTDTNNLASFSATTGEGTYILTATTAVNDVEIIAAATMLSWND